jgi:hypothetical protein
MWRRFTGMGLGVVLAVGLVPPPAQAVGGAAAAPCSVWLGSVTPTGAHTSSMVTATAPPSVQNQVTTSGPFGAGQVRFSARFVQEADIAGPVRSGLYGFLDGLHRRTYSITPSGEYDSSRPSTWQRIGTGWEKFSMVEEVAYAPTNGVGRRTMVYGMRKDGVLVRWNSTTGVYRAAGSYAGFSSVKSMTLISKQPTYDTFLANTRGGALYTIRIPSTSPMKPVVTPVRTRTWQGFESLTASKCGQYGTLLLGIDKDTKTGYLYAVGHANGTSTVIKSLGKVPGTFADPIYFRWAPIPLYDVANGD